MCGMMGVMAPLMKTAFNKKMGLVSKTIGGKAATAVGILPTKAPTATAAGAAAAASMKPALPGLKQIPDGAVPMKPKKLPGAGGGAYGGPARGGRRTIRMRPSLSLQPSSTLGSGNNSNGGVNIL